jgi:hypothetical protein
MAHQVSGSAGVRCSRQPDRQPEPWENSAAGPFCIMRRPRGTVEVWALAERRVRVTAPEREDQIIVGHDAAMQAADELAAQLDRRRGD